MRTWEHRPIITANLYNPAFCGEIICRCLSKYYDTVKSGFPYPLTFLILPIVLHYNIREKMPSKITIKSMHDWLEENQSVKIDFAKKTNKLLPITRETILFLLQINTIQFSDKGDLQLHDYKKKKIKEESDHEISDIFKKAEMVGNWFAKSGNVQTIYAFWGIRP